MIVSEEALASCEGAVFNIALNGATACHENATFDEMRHTMNNMSYITELSDIVSMKRMVVVMLMIMVVRREAGHGDVSLTL